MKPDRERVLVEGLASGVIGYLTVALFLAAANLLAGLSPFHTVAALGRLLFYGGSAAPPVIAAGPIIAYNGTHLALYLLIGFAAALLALEVERHLAAYYGGFFLTLIFVLFGTALIVAVAETVPIGMPWWMLALANLASVVGMLAYLLAVHPRLRRVPFEAEIGEESPA
jgi:hypothetical protein